jgi:zinc protease
MMSPFKNLCAAAALSLASVTMAFANPYTYTLKNGMSVIIKEDRRAPVATQMVWYRVGSVDEVDGHSGLAHALEHMMFKGTPKVGPGEFSKRVAAAGGRDNAFTSTDYTAYFQQIPVSKLPEMMALEADRMAHLSCAPKEFAPEIKVVMEERRMRTDDNPKAKLFEQTQAVAFLVHPYRRPVIGWMDDLEHMTAQDAQAWHKAWYEPNNAILVVVGDVDHEKVLAEAEATYGKIKARPLPPRRQEQEPKQIGERRVIVKAPGELPMVLLAYKAPKAESMAAPVDPFALTLLATVLDGHSAARLPADLIRGQKIAANAGASYDPLARGPVLFYLYGSPVPGKTPAELEAALKAEIAKIAKNGVPEDELARAKAQFIADRTYKLDSVFGQAMELGQMAALGFAPKDIDLFEQRIAAVSAKDIQDAAKKWFPDNQLTVGTLVPTGPATGGHEALPPKSTR